MLLKLLQAEKQDMFMSLFQMVCLVYDMLVQFSQWC